MQTYQCPGQSTEKEWTLHMDGNTQKHFFWAQKLFTHTPDLDLPRPKWALLLIHRCLQILLRNNPVLTYIRIRHFEWPQNNNFHLRKILQNSVQLCSPSQRGICNISEKNFYLQDTECTIICDHKPLEKFLKGKPKTIR